ncbi:MAG: ATP-binding protein, partial [Gammaproteobacteria bacterium]|nr:ATP-binding protein [Gammaproteobacteria bacterium]
MTEVSHHTTSKGLSPSLSNLGLHTDPFSREIQDEFFMLDAQRSQHINMLYHLAQNSELLLVVTGEPGSGKTSLLQHFIDMGDDTWRSCVVDANSMMNPEQLLIQIAEGFGLPQDSVNFDNGIEMLKRRLVDMKRSELISILIIDDAHELPAASLTMLMKLSELSDENEGLLRIILFS